MINCQLCWSRYELAFICVSHFTAALAVFQSNAPILLQVPVLLLVIASGAVYFWERIETYRGVGRENSGGDAQLMLGSEFARLDHRGYSLELSLPRLVYCSEFLLVLRFVQELQEGQSRSLYLTVWPDSMGRSDLCRLRRYLRFDLSAVLEGD